jgi:hypothetical protein
MMQQKDSFLVEEERRPLPCDDIPPGPIIFPQTSQDPSVAGESSQHSHTLHGLGEP